MKIRKIVLKFTLLFLMALTSNCAEPNENATVLPSIVPITPADTVTPIQVSVATNTPTPVPTSTVIATLPADEAGKKLLGLLADNGGCRLPYMWGIMPGKSTYQEAQAIFAPLSALSALTSFTPEGGAIFPIYTDSDLMLNTVASFSIDPLSDKQTVNKVRFQAREVKNVDNVAIDVFDSSFFSKQLGYYMLPNILTEYGKPTTVMLSTMAKLPSSGVPGGFKILLLYPDQGILVNYTMQMQITGESIMGCPSNAHVELELYPSGQADSFFDLLEPSGWTQIIQNTYKPLDEATALSQEEFFRIFSQPTDECILTPASLWPAPN